MKKDRDAYLRFLHDKLRQCREEYYEKNTLLPRLEDKARNECLDQMRTLEDRIEEIKKLIIQLDETDEEEWEKITKKSSLWISDEEEN